MKFLLLAAFVVACTASTVYRTRNISVNDDGTILITSPSGRRVVISKQVGLGGLRNIDISITGPNILPKRIQVQDNVLDDVIGQAPYSSVDSLGEEYRLKRGSLKGKTQGDILAEILREYQGVVDEVQYQKLLARISKAVKRGEVSPQVYQLLEELDQQQQIQQGILGQQGVQGILGQQGLQGVLGQQGIWGQQGVQGIWGQGVQGQVPLSYQYGLRSGLTGPQVLLGQYQQYPGSIYGSTLNVNPLLGRILTTGQGSYINDLLATQQLSGLPSSVLGGYGSQIVPQSTRGVLGRRTILSQLLGQTPYGQSQIAAGLRQIPQVYGVQQTIPQILQQQQQLQQVNQVEQAIEQLSEVQQQLQQQQQIAQLSGVQQQIQTIEQLNDVQQQQQQTGPLPGVQQAINAVELQQQQQQINQLQGVQQAIEQLAETQQQQQQQLQVAQLVEGLDELQQQQAIQQQLVQPQLIQQLTGVRQQPIVLTRQTVGLRNVPVSLQQLIGIPQTVGQTYGYRQSIYGGYRPVQPVTVQGRTGPYVTTVPQVQVVY